MEFYIDPKVFCARINTACTYAEVAANAASLYPVTNGIVTPIRFQAGVVQAVAGVAIAVFASIAMMFDDSDDSICYWRQWVRFGDNHILHGICNVAFASFSVYAFTMTKAGAAWTIFTTMHVCNFGRPIFDYHWYQNDEEIDLSGLMENFFA